MDRWASNDAIKHYMNITEMNYQNSSKGLDLSALLNAALSHSISRLLFLDYSHYFLWRKKVLKVCRVVVTLKGSWIVVCLLLSIFTF